MKNSENKGKRTARICEVQRGVYKVVCEEEELSARLKGKLYEEKGDMPVVGDYVSIQYNPYGDSVIEKVEKRKSAFIRPDQAGHAAGYVKTIKKQVLAANFDYVFIVTSLNQNFNRNRITRYITVTLQSGGKPVVVLTKADLCAEVEEYINEVREISNQVEVCVVSAITGKGLEELSVFLQKGTTIVLLGSSGVGKSTLVNAIAGKEVMKVNEVRKKDARGRHTTTHRQMFTLPSGVTIIDTPGIRELGMLDVKEGIEDVFSDIAELTSQCRFSNCTHRTEPGCAVKKAIKEKRLLPGRWELYCKLTEENKWGTEKSADKIGQ